MNKTPGGKAFLDASVLYGAFPRDFFIRLALRQQFVPRWSARVQDEWTTALLRNRPDLKSAHIARTQRLMDAHLPDARVEGHEFLIDSLSLPDPDDRHVLAAAIHCGAEVIVTFNLRDFPAPVLAGFGIEAIHPDAFVLRLVKTSADAVIETLRRLEAAYADPPMSMTDILEAMRRSGLAGSANAIAAATAPR